MTALAGRAPAQGQAQGSAQGSGQAAAGRGLPLPVVLYVLAVAVPLSVSVGPLVLTTLRILLLVLVVPLAVQLVAGRFGRILPTDLLFMAYLLWTVVALAANDPGMVVEQTGSVGVEFLGGYLVGRAYVRTPEAFERLCRLLVLVVCVSLPFALVEAVTGRHVLLEILRAVPGLGAPADVPTEERLGLTRVQAVFAHPIHYGLFCSMALPLAFVALRDATTPLRRWATSGAVLACVFLSLSSGALLAAVLQLGLIAWAALFARVQRRWWLLVGLFALAYVVVDLLSNRTPMRVFMTYATFSPGTAYWRMTINEWGMVNVWANPILGLGFADWLRPAWMHSPSVDNFWLLTAMRYGIPAFLFLALGYALGIVQVARRRLGADARLARMRRAWLFAFLGLSFTLYTVHVWGSLYSFVFFAFGSGLWLVSAEPGANGQAAVAAPPREGPRYSRFAAVPRGGAPARSPRPA